MIALKKMFDFGSFAALLNDLALLVLLEVWAGMWFPNLGVSVLSIGSSYEHLLGYFSKVKGSVFLKFAI